MCFSATVSFGASIIIGATGIQAYKKAETAPLKTFALVPIFFATQQFTEGFIWVSLQNPTIHFSNNFLPFITILYLFFAWVIWPAFIPYFCLKMEPDLKRRRYLKSIFGIGLAVSMILLFILFTFDTHASIDGRHILFERAGHIPYLKLLGSFYFISLIFPLFISSYRKMSIFGGINVLSFLFTWFMFQTYLISVWCFFAAISSVLVLYMIQDFQGQKFSIWNREQLLSH